MERNKTSYIKIYVCSPFKGNVELNTENARDYCRDVINENPNYIPVAPHLYFPQFLPDDDKECRRLGRTLSLELMKSCAELWVFGDKISDGMAAEISEAAYYGIPIRWFTAGGIERDVSIYDED